MRTFMEYWPSGFFINNPNERDNVIRFKEVTYNTAKGIRKHEEALRTPEAIRSNFSKPIGLFFPKADKV